MCLEVWVKDVPGTTSSKKPRSVVKLRLTTGVHKYANGLWTLMMKTFWPQFALNAKLIWWFKKLFSFDWAKFHRGLSTLNETSIHNDVFHEVGKA